MHLVKTFCSRAELWSYAGDIAIFRLLCNMYCRRTANDLSYNALALHEGMPDTPPLTTAKTQHRRPLHSLTIQTYYLHDLIQRVVG